MPMHVELDSMLKKAKAGVGADIFGDVRQLTITHRADHGCGAYTYDKGPLLTSLVRQLRPQRILELGTALGYTALCLSEGHEAASVTTIEADPLHVRIARENIETHGRSGRISVLHGRFEQIMPTLEPTYDLVFFDGFAPDLEIYGHIQRLTQRGGHVASANLGLASVENGRYLAAISDRDDWQTAFVDASGETAFSRRL